MLGGQDGDKAEDSGAHGNQLEKQPKETRPTGQYYPGGDTPDSKASSLAHNQHQWSIPQPPPEKLLPDPHPQPFSAVAMGAPSLGLKPKILCNTKPYEVTLGDLDRFLADCQLKFEVYGQYYVIHPYRVVFAISRLDRKAKDWWTYHQEDYMSESQVTTGSPTGPASSSCSSKNSTTLL